VLADAIDSVDSNHGAKRGEPRVDRLLQKMNEARDNLLKTTTLDDIRSPEGESVLNEKPDHGAQK